MTSGSLSVTSGKGDPWSWLEHPRFGPLLVVVLLGIALGLVNVSSVLAEARKTLAVWEPFVWEGSSFAIIVAMAPAVGAAIRRWPPRRDSLARFVLVHGALTMPFALIHVAAAFVMRNAAYWVMEKRYDFFDQGLTARLLYEWRKDVLVYAGIALVYALFQARRAAEHAPSPNDRIAIQDGGARLFLKPAEIVYVEAAGNYVEIHVGTRAHLVRGSLTAWETRLSEYDFVRVHRARLVNRARIAQVRRSPAGDVEITLDDARTVAGSRRYRAALS